MSKPAPLGFERLQGYRVEGVGRWIQRERFVIWVFPDNFTRVWFAIDFHVPDDGSPACGPSVSIDHVGPWELRKGLLSAVERVCRELRWDSTPSDLQGILARMRAPKYQYTPDGTFAAIPAEQARPV